uniref:Uncharacterized protein n=1 Tax=viral metagenome TaxID=1070528 RepID=A0A6H1ZM52_9ZZZZ
MLAELKLVGLNILLITIQYGKKKIAKTTEENEMITLEVYLEDNQNPHHPKAGWYKSGSFETVKEAVMLYCRVKLTRARTNNKEVTNEQRIVITEDYFSHQIRSKE